MAIRVIDDGRTNPCIVVPPDALVDWLRSVADARGYADHDLNAVQIQVEQPFAEGFQSHDEVPSILVILSRKEARR